MQLQQRHMTGSRSRCSLLKSWCLTDAAETAIGQDPVDTQIRSAFSPIVNPVLSTTARRPTTATATAVAAGPASPLVSRSLHVLQMLRILQDLYYFQSPYFMYFRYT